MTTARRRRLSFVVVGAGLLLAVFLQSRLPRDQHVRLSLGDAAPGVTELDVQYVTAGGESARETRLTFPPGSAPRIVALDPELEDGPYQLRIGVTAREGRRTVERQVTLSGGTSHVDLADLASARPPSRP